MILHLGGDFAVYEKNVIMVLDSECTVNPSTREYLERADIKQSGFAMHEQPQSYVVVEEDGKSQVYASLISSQTLQKRSGYTINNI